MIKTATKILFLAIATSFSFLLFSPPPKSFYHSLFISTALSDNVSASQHLWTLTRRPHVAGSEANAEAAAYVLSVFTSCNIKSHIASYAVSLTYPVSRSLSLTRPFPEPTIDFSLRQEIYDGDPFADVADQVLPTFHGYGKSGTATGPVVYVNYGRVEDYVTLKEMGVNVSGKDYGGGSGDARWFPDDKWMPPSGVQVGSVYDGVGDPTTPGWASTEGCERISNEEVEKTGDVPLIPSLPISAQDGHTIMRSIEGQVVNQDWQGDKDAPIYRTGPGPGVVNLSYKVSMQPSFNFSISQRNVLILRFNKSDCRYNQYFTNCTCFRGTNVIATIQNVIGVITGTEEPDRFVILGNHRDAWTFGAVDPNSGTAALLEVAERLEKLRKKGWKPRRTIVLCNWDAEEYGLTGSTEWVEDNREMLASRVVAYLNVDSAVYGPGFYASATPQLDELLKQATQQVQDPDNSSQTVYDSWVGSSHSPVVSAMPIALNCTTLMR
ncbi:hypothetical protein Patl1_13367 [Pistacia atlantica]|uniref:Uncharacterized protein n=1 Tax=Pistacia atlantica TaxID=434234 RepID=A0ACC1AT51_9ROSI|nr:hypothetical protein Patl1_13367 [Pistacia atlantica]